MKFQVSEKEINAQQLLQLNNLESLKCKAFIKKYKAK